MNGVDNIFHEMIQPTENVFDNLPKQQKISNFLIKYFPNHLFFSYQIDP